MANKKVTTPTFNEQEMMLLNKFVEKATDKFKVEIYFDLNKFIEDVWQRFGFKKKTTWIERALWGTAGFNIGAILTAAATAIGVFFF